MKYYLTYALVAIVIPWFLTGCIVSSANRFYGPDGELCYKVQCSSEARNWDECHTKAEDKCPDDYYLIGKKVSSDGERSIEIQCKHQNQKPDELYVTFEAESERNIHSQEQAMQNAVNKAKTGASHLCREIGKTPGSDWNGINDGYCVIKTGLNGQTYWQCTASISVNCN